VSALTVTRDGKRLLTASRDWTALVWDISLAGYAPKSAGPPTTDEQANLWDKLLEMDAATSYRAMATLAAYPKIAVPLIAARTLARASVRELLWLAG